MRALMSILALVVCLGACASVAQESEQVYPTVDEAYGFTPWQDLNVGPPATGVSFYELLANGAEFDNQYIRISGVFLYSVVNDEVWAQALYPNRESFEYRVYEDSIGLVEFLSECSGPLELLNGEFVTLTGIYRHSRKKLTPVDHIRYVQLDAETRSIAKDEILCSDSSIVFKDEN